METFLSMFSPRKQPPAEPPKPLPHPRSQTYSKKERVRAKRALDRMSVSDTHSPQRSRTSNASSTNDTTGEISFLSQQETTVVMDTEADAAPAQSSPVVRSSPAVRRAINSSPAVRSSPAARKSASPIVRRRPGRSTPAKRSRSSLLKQDVEMADVQPEEDEPAEEEHHQEDTEREDEPAQEHQQEDAEEDDEQEYTFDRIVKHRWADNHIELRIEWEEGPATWEPEENFHRDAPDALFEYWRSKGGRPNNPKHPDMYDIFAIRKHTKNKQKLLVEWVGYESSEMTWMPRKVVEETAKSMADEYMSKLKPKKK
ncbi:hypothetical protein FDECE_10400 [Fusarium decemcellulare]|nr:hypothetical protein FDECE_10400 [Fusarium decemcellulare]